jgi:hypothetical protein
VPLLIHSATSPQDYLDRDWSDGSQRSKEHQAVFENVVAIREMTPIPQSDWLTAGEAAELAATNEWPASSRHAD